MDVRRPSRRRFLKTTGLIAVSAILPAVGCDRHDVSFLETPAGPGEPGSGKPGDPPITPNSRFYVQTVRGPSFDPNVNTTRWVMSVNGLVDTPVSGFTYDDLLGMPLVRQTMTVQCIGNWVGGPLAGNAEFGGTPLRNLLDMAGVQRGAIRVRFDSADGYTTSIPLERALRSNVLLAWEMNGEVLPSKHGYPVRLINPGHYGQKMPKWITRIQLIDEVYLGFWERLPAELPVHWSDAAVATVNSRIDAPLSLWDDVVDTEGRSVEADYQTLQGTADTVYTVYGVAMAGERTVERVELSTDGGATWNRARLTTRVMPNVWVVWAYDWPLPPSGRYELVARAVDSSGDGQPQVDQGNDIFDGRTSWHHVPVNVLRTGPA